MEISNLTLKSIMNVPFDYFATSILIKMLFILWLRKHCAVLRIIIPNY